MYSVPRVHHVTLQYICHLSYTWYLVYEYDMITGPRSYCQLPAVQGSAVQYCFSYTPVEVVVQDT